MRAGNRGNRAPRSEPEKESVRPFYRTSLSRAWKQVASRMGSESAGEGENRPVPAAWKSPNRADGCACRDRRDGSGGSAGVRGLQLQVPDHERSELVEPTFGRGVLAFLFLMAILWDDKFQLHGQHPGGCPVPRSRA